MHVRRTIMAGFILVALPLAASADDVTVSPATGAASTSGSNALQPVPVSSGLQAPASTSNGLSASQSSGIQQPLTDQNEIANLLQGEAAGSPYETASKGPSNPWLQDSLLTAVLIVILVVLVRVRRRLA